MSDTVAGDTIQENPPPAIIAVDTVEPPDTPASLADTSIKVQDEAAAVDTMPQISEAPEQVKAGSMKMDTLPETTAQSDTAEPEPGIIYEAPETPVTVDTIPVEWVKSTSGIFPQQDTFLVAITDPDTLMALSQYNLAAQYWKLEKRQEPDHFTIVLMYACSGATIDSIKNVLPRPNELFILPRDVDDRSCFIVCWGDFRTRDAAEKQFESLPGWFAENGLAPMIRPLFKIDRLTRLSLTRLIMDSDHIKRE